MTITVDLKRDDGQVTRLVGTAALAVCMDGDVPPVADPGDREAMKAALPSMPIVSIRCDEREQVVWLLGSLVRAIRDVDPEIVELAMLASEIINSLEPGMRVGQPRRG